MILIQLLELDTINKYFSLLTIGGRRTCSLFYIEFYENKITHLEILFIRLKK